MYDLLATGLSAVTPTGERITVADADTAWHARSANPSSPGIEREGFIDDPAWFSDTMYRSSAALTKWLCDTYGLAKTRT